MSEPILSEIKQSKFTPVEINRKDNKVKVNKPFNESWEYPSEQKKKIIGCSHYKIYTTNEKFKSGRDKFTCVFYNRNQEILKTCLCMAMTSQAGKEYQLVQI